MNFERISQPKSIEEQFEEREVLELYGGRVEIVDISPAESKSEVPVVMAPGWNGTPEVYKDNVTSLAELGRRSICIDAPHGIEHEITEESAKDMPDAELRKVAALIRSLEEKGVEKVDAVGHSEAGIYITLAATLYPEKFRNIVLVNPGGMIGKDTPLRLSVDFAKDVVKQTVNSIKDSRITNPSLRSGVEVTKSLLSNPLQALKEVLAISDSQIHDMLADLKKRGIGISIIHSVDDQAFPMERMQEIADPSQMDGFYSVKGTHGEFFLRGKEYTALADQALTAMEKKSRTSEEIR